MKLFDKVNEDIKAAMLSKEKGKLEALRAIKAAFLLAKTEKGAPAELTGDAELRIVQKLIKQRKESAEIYLSQGRKDLYDIEMFEASVIEQYLPKQLNAEELQKALKAIIDRVGAKTPSDMGKIMGIATKELAGKADGKLIAETVKVMLTAK